MEQCRELWQLKTKLLELFVDVQGIVGAVCWCARSCGSCLLMHKELWELFFDVKGIVGAVFWWARNCGSWPGSQTSVPGTPSTSPVPRLLGTQQSPGAAPDSRPSWKPLGTGPGIQSLAAGQTDYNQSIINAVWYTFMNTPISSISYQ